MTYQQDLQFNLGAVVTLRWPDFKAILAAKGLSPQYVTRVDSYTVFAVDGNISYVCILIFLEKSEEFPFAEDYSREQNDTDLAEFIASYQSHSNKPTRKVDESFRPIMVPEPRVGTETIYTTHNLCDKVSWFGDSERVVDKTLTSSDGYIWESGDGYWIDMISGRVQDDDGLVDEQKLFNPEDPHGYAVIVTVDGEEKTMREPFEQSGGDYEVFWEDGYIKSFDDWTGKNVIASYSKANGSTFILRPLPGYNLNIEAAEADFSEDCIMTDGIEYTVYGYSDIFAPQLGLPSGTKIPISTARYKRLSQIFNEAIGSYPLISVYGSATDQRTKPQSEFRRTERGVKSFVQSIPFRYATVRTLQSALGLELRIRLAHDRPFEGSLGTLTFYCTSSEA